MRFTAFFVAIVAVALLMAPPAFAGYIGTPLDGVSWTPDVCGDPSSVYLCDNLYHYVTGLSGQAMDAAFWACDGVVDMGSCYGGRYSDYMTSSENQTCTHTFMGGSDEMDSWCVAQFNREIDEIMHPDHGCTGAC